MSAAGAKRGRDDDIADEADELALRTKRRSAVAAVGDRGELTDDDDAFDDDSDGDGGVEAARAQLEAKDDQARVMRLNGTKMVRSPRSCQPCADAAASVAAVSFPGEL